MAGENIRNLRHILVAGRTSEVAFTSPPGGGGGRVTFPQRNRAAHAALLSQELRAIRERDEAVRAERQVVGLSTEYGLVLEFESEPGFMLQTQSLERKSAEIALLNVRTRVVERPGGDMKVVEMATVRVPFGRLQVFEELVASYRDENTAKKGNPAHEPLVAPIKAIRTAALEAFWTEPTPLPVAMQETAWEAWLHLGYEPEARENVLARFRAAAQAAGIVLVGNPLLLPETTVVIIRATRERLQDSVELLDCLSELRKPPEAAGFFDAMEVVEQARWVDDLRVRVSAPHAEANAVCLLDTGMNHGHPLLGSAVAPDGLQAFDPAWGTHDGHKNGNGHGTQMAGLALYGDLVPVLASNAPVVLSHWVESVKAYNDRAPQGAEQWGNIIRHSIATIELAAPERRRVFSQQIASPGVGLVGRPTSWSAVTDQLCVGYGEDPADPRLIVICGGNAPAQLRSRYPDANRDWSVHDPAQAWNALTVGACTHKDRIVDAEAAHYPVAAKRGQLSPISTTSCAWDPDWPIKPDLVVEGGNRAVDQDTLLKHPDLELLTTAAAFQQRPLCSADGTSSAAVQVARMAAQLQSEYPAYWPETLRALLVHSAEWNAGMLGQRLARNLDKAEILEILRHYGHGEPDLGRALKSARSAVTLVVQDHFQPFVLEGGVIKTNVMRFHALPWPVAVLQGMGHTRVELRVTLSYFIEPNPGVRLTNDRYRYASCHLRFEIQRPTESIETFKARVNKKSRENGFVAPRGSDSADWVVGTDNRHRGSLHQDTWVGTAADLAAKPGVAIYPVTGWWRLRRHLERYHARVRYALVVSLRSPEQAVDLYTPIAQVIGLAVPVAVPVG